MSYTCPKCGRVSHHPRDAVERWCAVCGGEAEREWFAALAAAELAYHDPSYAERACEHCNRVFRGSAVYCSLKCALDDAD